MTTTSTDVYRPVDFVLLELARDRRTGEAGPALMELVERRHRCAEWSVRHVPLAVGRAHGGSAAGHGAVELQREQFNESLAVQLRVPFSAVGGASGELAVSLEVGVDT